MVEYMNIDRDAIVRKLDAVLEYYQSSQPLRVYGGVYAR